MKTFEIIKPQIDESKFNFIFEDFKFIYYFNTNEQLKKFLTYKDFKNDGTHCDIFYRFSNYCDILPNGLIVDKLTGKSVMEYRLSYKKKIRAYLDPKIFEREEARNNGVQN